MTDNSSEANVEQMSQLRVLTRDRDLETGDTGDGTAATGLRCATSESSVATWLSRGEDVTQPRSPVISLKWAV